MVLGAKVSELLLNLPVVMKQDVKAQACRSVETYEVHELQPHLLSSKFQGDKEKV